MNLFFWFHTEFELLSQSGNAEDTHESLSWGLSVNITAQSPFYPLPLSPNTVQAPAIYSCTVGAE